MEKAAAHTCRAALAAPAAAQHRGLLKVAVIVGQQRGGRPAQPRGALRRGRGAAGVLAAAAAAGVAAALFRVTVNGGCCGPPASGGVPSHCGSCTASFPGAARPAELCGFATAAAISNAVIKH